MPSLMDALGEDPSSQAVTEQPVSQPRTLDTIDRALEAVTDEREEEEELEDQFDYTEEAGIEDGVVEEEIAGEEEGVVEEMGEEEERAGEGEEKSEKRTDEGAKEGEEMSVEEIPCGQGGGTVIPDQNTTLRPIPASLESLDEDKENAPHPPTRRLVSQLPVSKIKKIMRMDPDTVMVKGDAVVAMAFAAELFLKTLATASARVAVRSKRKTIKRSDIDTCVSNMENFEFLEDML